MNIVAGLYEHYKGGFYQALGIGQHSETGEYLVVYISLDANHSGPRIRCRPAAMWNQLLTWPGGHIGPRFRYVGIERDSILPEAEEESE